jgi:large subunit ribosomal protein L31e
MKYEDLVIGSDVNELMWRRGIEKPPRRIRVRAVKNADNVVTVHLPEGE